MIDRGGESGAHSASAQAPLQESQTPSRAVPLVFGARERRIIFHEMIRAELEGGILRYSKRRQLLHYARKIGIPRFEACLMIAEVQHSKGQLQTPRVLSDDEILLKLREANQSNAMMRQVVIASTAAIVLNVWMLHWLL